MKITIVGGVFNEDGGRPSRFVSRLSDALSGSDDVRVFTVNGGSYVFLSYFVERLENLAKEDVVIWMADVPNELPKLAEKIKARWPEIFLVTSKNNMDGKYTTQDLLGRALKTKSNLLLELTRERGRVETTILDPLGSSYCTREVDVEEVARVLASRLMRLATFRRVGSVCAGERIAPQDDPDMLRFYGIVRAQAERFHAIIHGAGHERMLGNASFRCAKGFPSVRSMGRDGLVFVSRRNVDKRSIGPDAFVAVRLDSADPVRYYGDDKPSVDTPIQLALYRHYRNVRYMLHSHTYLWGSKSTSEPIPCGAMEEARAIIDLFPDRDTQSLSVNLMGHGSIVLTDKLDGLEFLPWIPMDVPEPFCEVGR